MKCWIISHNASWFLMCSLGGGGGGCCGKLHIKTHTSCIVKISDTLNLITKQKRNENIDIFCDTIKSASCYNDF